jgi:hypothetical protein
MNNPVIRCTIVFIINNFEVNKCINTHLYQNSFTIVTPLNFKIKKNASPKTGKAFKYY